MFSLEILICSSVILVAVLLVLHHNKKAQGRVMDYYKEGREFSQLISTKSLENQEKMLDLLQEISKKLDK